MSEPQEQHSGYNKIAKSEEHADWAYALSP